MPAHTITAEEKARFERIASLQGWTIGQEYHCGYSGDSSTIPHGGFFYDPRDWTEYGYASVVEFWMESDTEWDEDTLVVSCGTIHRPDDDELTSIMQDILDQYPDERDNVHAQIEACRYANGIEPDEDFSGRFEKRFKLRTWAEWRIWRSVDGWLRALGE